MEAKIYNLKKEVVGNLSLPEDIFAKKWNPDLVDQVLRAELSNRRTAIAHAKGRGEVSGGGIKPWRQKGTGRARHGSIRSPIWRHGGVSLGPQKDKNYSQKINKKMKRGALYSILSKKLSGEEVKFIDSLDLKLKKTNELDSSLKNFLNLPKKSKSLSTLLVVDKENVSIFKISKNIPKVMSLRAKDLDVESMLKYKNVLFDKNAVNDLVGLNTK